MTPPSRQPSVIPATELLSRTWAVVTPVTCRYINTSSSMGTLRHWDTDQECGTVVCRIVIIWWPGICSDLHCLQCTKHPSVSPSRCLLQGRLITTPLHHPDHHPQHRHFLPSREYHVMGSVVREIFHWMIKTGTCLNEVELGEGGGVPDVTMRDATNKLRQL